MAKKSSKLFAGVLVSTIIISNCLFVYAKDFDTYEFVTYDESDNYDKLNINSLTLKLNSSAVLKNSGNENLVLSLLNMNIDQYKNELKNGEDLHSLLEKSNLKNDFLNSAYHEYKQILENAVQSGSITLSEMDTLLNNYENSL